MNNNDEPLRNSKQIQKNKEPLKNTEINKMNIWEASVTGSLPDIKYYYQQSRSNITKPCPSDHFNTPLHLACLHGHFNVVKFLVMKGANVNVFNTLDITPLIFASQSGYCRIIGYLIDNGANVNVRDRQGNTALHWAISSNYISSMMVLIQNGANKMARNFANQIPLDVAPIHSPTVLRYLLPNY